MMEIWFLTMPSIDFTLRDDTSQTLNLTNINDVIYVSFTKLDNTVINVPISFMFSSTEQQLTVDDFITSLVTTSMVNDNTDVMRESGYRIADIFVKPDFADDRALSVLKFCKELKYNINGKTDEVIEVTSGSLPTGLDLEKNSNGNFAIEGYATKENLPPDYSERLNIDAQTTIYDRLIEAEDEIKLEDLYKGREIEFRNIQYAEGSNQFSASETITDNITKDSTALKCIETYVINGETRTRFIIDEMTDMKPFDYYDERIICDVYNNTRHDKNWTGTLISSDCESVVTYDEVRTKYPDEISNNDYKTCTFTLGLCSESGSGYCETKEFSINVRRNYDNTRDNLLVGTKHNAPHQQSYSTYNNDSHIYYHGDTTKASYLALFFLPITKNDGVVKNVAISYAELDLKKNDTTDLDIAIDGNITFARNISGNELQSKIELNTEDV